MAMSTYEWQQASSPRCVYADTFYRTARDAVFKRLTEATTANQFQAAQESLDQLRQELEQDMPAMHFSSLIGTHLCVKHLYREAVARLRSLALLQPEPLPPPPPEPPEPQPPLTHEDVENLFRKLPPDTYFGKERDEDDSE
jgi:hypothetical protein